MGALQTAAKLLRPPKLSDIAGAPGEVKGELQKTKMNKIDVIYLDRDFRAGDQVVGTISRKTKISTVNVKIPEPLTFFKTRTFYNRTTGRDMMLCVEGYPWSLQLDAELKDEENNDFANGKLGKEGYQIPIIIDRLPRYIFKNNPDEELAKLDELSPSILADIGNVELTDGVTKKEISGSAMLIFIGFLLGMVTAFAWVAGMSGG